MYTSPLSNGAVLPVFVQRIFKTSWNKNSTTFLNYFYLNSQSFNSLHYMYPLYVPTRYKLREIHKHLNPKGARVESTRNAPCIADCMRCRVCRIAIVDAHAQPHDRAYADGGAEAVCLWASICAHARSPTSRHATADREIRCQHKLLPMPPARA